MDIYRKKTEEKTPHPMPMRREFHTFKCLFHTEYTKIFCKSNDKSLYLQKNKPANIQFALLLYICSKIKT